ncbi:dehydrogenase [Gordoniibacillus kamchatkensis]|uniref:Dehydrogenase n=1 Tax=Gordoniibacillus kamchatkensis TaxID=1590651 RepID=A0ABR5A756_9BACL|nr:Gfo/Idh/MocA family oxidoreductase [Paenibacillus sp. VKM B-2647]KIL36800.1 dehydrogenase [Paenibacillus sp. VKM B-2647]
MSRKRIGIVGLGDIAGKVYLPLLTALESVEVIGIQSRTETTVQRVGEQYRIPQAGRCRELGELLKLQPQAVFVHSPTETHYEVVMACLRAGVHVYVDKPLSYSLTEAERMADEAAARGLLLGVGFNRRFAPLYREAKAWLEAAGGFDWCAVQKHRVRRQSGPAKHTVYDDLIHMLDLLLWLGGSDYRLLASELGVDADGRLDCASGLLRYDAYDGKREPCAMSGSGLAGPAGSARAGAARSRNGTAAKAGATASFSMVRLAGRDLEELELHGGGRSAEVVNMETAQWSEAGGLPAARTFGSWETVLERRGFTGVVNHFLACMDDPAACEVRADRVLETHRLAEMVSAL